MSISVSSQASAMAKDGAAGVKCIVHLVSTGYRRTIHIFGDNAYASISEKPRRPAHRPERGIGRGVQRCVSRGREEADRQPAWETGKS